MNYHTYSDSELSEIARKVQTTERPEGDPASHKSKFFKVYKAPGYPIDPKLELERMVVIPMDPFPHESPAELCKALKRRMMELSGYHN